MGFRLECLSLPRQILQMSSFGSLFKSSFYHFSKCSYWWEKKRRTPEPSDETAPRFIVQCYLFGWGLFLFLLINYPQKPIYLMSIICLISCRLRCRSRSVGLIISYGDVKELEIQLKYTAAFFPGFLHINKNTCSKNRLTQL